MDCENNMQKIVKIIRHLPYILVILRLRRTGTLCKILVHSSWLFLADRAARSRPIIGYWHDTVVCQSVSLCVTICIVEFRVGVGS